MNNQMADSLKTNHLDGGHLDEVQFSTLLAGESLASEAQAHFDGCAECHREMEQVAAAMESFSELSLDWAERRSATMAPVRAPERTAWVRPLAWASATAVLALGVTLGVRHQNDQSAQPVAVAQVPGASAASTAAMVAPQQAAKHLTREQQIAEDNRMLLAIRHELARPAMLNVRRSRSEQMANETVTN